MSELLLSPVQARVVAALVEKSLTTPQYYPMTVNALTAACNQKNCRHPVMQLREGEVGSALLDLLELDLVAEDPGARSPKWRHRFTHQLLLKPPSQGLLVTLMLRGPQTLAELRANAANLGGPEDQAEVKAVLDDLADRAQPLVKRLDREGGRSQERYAHLLCGEEAIPEMASAPVAASGGLAARVDELERRVAELERLLQA